MIAVKLPDGSTAQFPDGTSPDTMSFAIRQKFPVPGQTGQIDPSSAQSNDPPQTAQAAQPQTPTFADFKAGFDRNYQQANPQPQNVATNPRASVLPGVLGQVANTLNASTAGASQGMTAGWGDELAAAAMTPIDMLRNRSLDVPGQFQNALQANQANLAQTEALNPQAAHAGDVTGSLAMIGKAPLQAGANVLAAASKPSSWWRGALSGGGYGAVSGAGRGVSPDERMGGAAEGALIGAGTGLLAHWLGAGNTPEPASIPTVQDLKAAKDAAYKKVDDSGVVFAPQAYDKLVNDLQSQAVADNINPDLHGGSAAILNMMGNKPAGYAPTLTELDQIRQQAKRDAFSNTADSHFGNQILDGIDNFINTAGPSQMASGMGPEASQAINDARAANLTYRKTQAVQSLINNAELNAGAANSGGNINNALRQQFKTMLKQDEYGISAAQKAGFTPDEIAQMRDLTVGDTKENALRFMGNLLKPNLLNSIQYAAAISAFHPAAALPAAGQAMKTFADMGTVNKANSLADMIASAGTAPAVTAAPVSSATQQLVDRLPMLLGLQAPRLATMMMGPSAVPSGAQ